MKAPSLVLNALAEIYEQRQAGRTGEAKRDVLIEFEQLLKAGGCEEGSQRDLAERELRDAEREGILHIVPLHKRDRSSFGKIRFSHLNEEKLYERLNRATPGHYMAPALFVDVDNAMRIAREEIFGPVAAMIPARDYEHALAIANDTPFGLCGGIVTASLKHAQHFKRNAEVGMAMVNLPTAGVDFHAPFGGRKGSSLGSREQGRYAVEFYTTVKTAYTPA